MKEPAAHLDAVGSVVEALAELALEPVPETGLRMDLLFDFPLPSAALARRAITFRVQRKAWRVAAEADLLRLKKLAQASRSSPGDAEDIAFLEARRARSRK